MSGVRSIDWTHREMETLLRLAQAGETWTTINGEIGRGAHACENRFQRVATKLQKEARARALAARRSLKAPVETPARKKPIAPIVSAAPRSLTAAVLGDPLPGRSALDQRQQPPARPTLATGTLR
ncbi:hypothetical protein [Bradyrhizobium sp. SZCCHNRI2049]|uniref:hypothetical protein n=1 Tax=Bradyrhizobium sp. SZCCHNRI2049 TaxID=3057287 RepID=UPI0029164AA4|nr:hypothetical protein [Bradyrhizobium sp. SZCCHNRI2049]